MGVFLLTSVKFGTDILLGIKVMDFLISGIKSC